MYGTTNIKNDSSDVLKSAVSVASLDVNDIGVY
jgi:hypothetical protein